MNANELSRVDKLSLDDRQMAPSESQRLRLENSPSIAVGDDVARRECLQLALLTAVNLSVRSFGAVKVSMSAASSASACQTRVSVAPTLGQAVEDLGGVLIGSPSELSKNALLIGDAPQTSAGLLRVTFDGWVAQIAPADSHARLNERGFNPLAAIAAAALGVGDLFAAFAGIEISAGSRKVAISLWDPIKGASNPDAWGPPLDELPGELSIFGLGHLGQAYAWALAGIPWGDRLPSITLYDDDAAEPPNLETGAVLRERDLGRPKVRVVAEWLEARGFKLSIIQRRIDDKYRLDRREPILGLCGFDDNKARQWLTGVGIERLVDCGLGGEKDNFDSISLQTWPSQLPAHEIWRVLDEAELAGQNRRRQATTATNAAYAGLATDECGRVLLAEKSIAVPYVGAVASSLALAETIKLIAGGPCVGGLFVQLSSLGCGPLSGYPASQGYVEPVRGLPTVRATSIS